MTLRVRERLATSTSPTGNPGRLLALACALAVLAAACSAETGGTTSPVTSAPEQATTTTRPPDPAIDGPVLRIGLIDHVTAPNWWAAMGGDASIADRAIFSNTKKSMFELTRPGFAQVPALAATTRPEPVRQQGSLWVVEQRIRDDLLWSDGERVTAGDLVFYFDVVREFALGDTHRSHFPAAVTDVSAVDDLTVRVEFDRDPSLTDWETGVAMTPFVPAHFWEPHVRSARAAADAARAGISDAEARAAVAAASLTDADPDNDLTPEEVTQAQVESQRADVAAEAGRDYLYSVEAIGEPSCGPMVLESLGGDVAFSGSNPGYFGRGTETTIFSDGSVRLATPDTDQVYGGGASGGVVDHVVVGPFISGIEWREYESDDAAYEAETAGQVDFVIDPDGLTFDQYNEMAAAGQDLSISPADGFRFLAFNLRKPPMSDPVFREAVATVIDKELIASSLFNGTLFPAYTVVDPALITFYNPDVDRPGWSGGEPMGTGERFEAAIALLADAGYTWDREPELVYDESGHLVDVVAGGGLEMPNGVDVPDLTILAAPGSGEDPLRATYALWIEQWMTDLGIPVTTETTDLGSIAETALSPTTTDDVLSWDLHVLGWGGPDLALPGLTLVALFHSRNQVEAGGLNATGYASAEFDAAADSFVASDTIDEAARWTKEMERVISEDLPYVVLYRPAVIEVAGSRVTFPVETIMGGHGSTAWGWPGSVRIDR